MSELTGLPGETVEIKGESMSTDERARRFKFAIAEYARNHREWLRQSDDLEKAKKRVDQLEVSMLNARQRVVGLVGSPAYIDFLEALHWRYMEHGWDGFTGVPDDKAK